MRETRKASTMPYVYVGTRSAPCCVATLRRPTAEGRPAGRSGVCAQGGGGGGMRKLTLSPSDFLHLKLPVCTLCLSPFHCLSPSLPPARPLPPALSLPPSVSPSPSPSQLQPCARLQRDADEALAAQHHHRVHPVLRPQQLLRARSCGRLHVCLRVLWLLIATQSKFAGTARA